MAAVGDSVSGPQRWRRATGAVMASKRGEGKPDEVERKRNVLILPKVMDHAQRVLEILEKCRTAFEHAEQMHRHAIVVVPDEASQAFDAVDDQPCGYR